MKNIIETLEQVREQIRAEAELQMDGITRAIEVLQGRKPDADGTAAVPGTAKVRVVRADGVPSVREMVEMAGEALAEGKDEDYFFTFKQLKDWCLAKWPEQQKKINTGFYPGIGLVVEAGVWDKTDNGFKIATQPKA